MVGALNGALDNLLDRVRDTGLDNPLNRVRDGNVHHTVHVVGDADLLGNRDLHIVGLVNVHGAGNLVVHGNIHVANSLNGLHNVNEALLDAKVLDGSSSESRGDGRGDERRGSTDDSGGSTQSVGDSTGKNSGHCEKRTTRKKIDTGTPL
mmetsp:Transcript_54305/g.96521  ORF Transcript_54305/g.96521 Transcript_54305/m.96521 type:complete len:150 (-) Transcript_54305:32-481(-)